MTRAAQLIFALVLVLSLLLLTGEQAMASRGDKNGTSAAPELLIPVGGRYLAMGGASSANAVGVEAIYWNPAGLSRGTQSTEALFSYMSYIADIGVEYFAVGSTFEGFGTLGFALKNVSIGDIEVTTEDTPDGTGQTFSPTYVTFGLTYSRLLTDRISVGLTANLISERIDRVSASGFAFDFGVQYSSFASINGLAIGIAIKNIGGGLKFDGEGLYREATATDNLRPPTLYKVEAQTDELPSIIELGVSYKRQLDEKNALTGVASFENNNMSFDQYHLGLEYGFNDLFFARLGGVLYPKEATSEDKTYGLTAGAGVHYAAGGLDFTLDYAYRAVQFLGGNHVFSIKMGF